MASVRAKSSTKKGVRHGEVNKLPTESRLRNPLNVVVERISATRARVQGDVSVESLRELLMSSLALLPAIKPSDPSDPKAEIGRDETSAETDGSFSKDGKRDGKGADRRKNTRGRENEFSDGLSEKERRRINDDEGRSRKSKKSDQRGSRSGSGKKRGRGSESRSNSSEDEEGDEESLPSCLSVFGTEESLFSCDGRWLRSYFGRPLIQGLKNVAKLGPRDPVSYLAFFLRKYRSLEEERQRRRIFEGDLKAQRSLLASRLTTELQPKGEKCPESRGDSSDGEEEGDRGDRNFENYHPGSEEIVETA